ncbi:unnamed protein product [Bubo scandiacus]
MLPAAAPPGRAERGGAGRGAGRAAGLLPRPGWAGLGRAGRAGPCVRAAAPLHLRGGPGGGGGSRARQGFPRRTWHHAARRQSRAGRSPRPGPGPAPPPRALRSAGRRRLPDPGRAEPSRTAVPAGRLGPRAPARPRGEERRYRRLCGAESRSRCGEPRPGGDSDPPRSTGSWGTRGWHAVLREGRGGQGR